MLSDNENILHAEKIKQEPKSPDKEGIASTGEAIGTSAYDFDMASSSDEADGEEVTTWPPSGAVVSSSKTVEGNLELLMKVFPYVDNQILTMTLKACNNDAILAIESLIKDNSTKPITPIPPQHHASTPQRVSVLQRMPYNTAMVRPGVLQSRGAPFASAYPGYVHGFGSHSLTSPMLQQWNRVQEHPYSFHGGKSPWCNTLPNQPLCKMPIYSRAFVSPNLPHNTSEETCKYCFKLLSAEDKYCSQCGQKTSANDYS